MLALPKNLANKTDKRRTDNALRSLTTTHGLIDFSSNDYLGFARDSALFEKASQALQNQTKFNGATGSRLLTGHDPLFYETEKTIAGYHGTETALIFNSGYDANLGVLSSLPARSDLVLYDAFAHASIRDGLSLSPAKKRSFSHNNFEDLEQKLLKFSDRYTNLWIVTEAVFSMDGDTPDFAALARLTTRFGARVIVDEAHATGVLTDLTHTYHAVGLSSRLTARIVTFGKALGCHGAAVLGSKDLKEYLINFARSLIYTTALPPHSVATVQAAYQTLQSTDQIGLLFQNIQFFHREVQRLQLTHTFALNPSAIQTFRIPGNTETRQAARFLAEKGYDVRPILSPTVPAGKECLRFCLHSFQTFSQITGVLEALQAYLSQKNTSLCTD